MKIIGAIIIIASCWGWGIDFYKSNINKLNFTKGLFNGIEFLKSEIVYSCDLLGESIVKSAVFSGAASTYMEKIGNELIQKGVSTESAFDKVKPFLLKNTTKETFVLTRELFLQLGEKDSENHEKMIDGYLQKMSSLIKKYSEFCAKECVILKKTGAIVGVGIAVLLI